MPTYRLDIEYDGTRFAGWQVQASGRTVQGVLLETLRRLLGQSDIDLQGAGRTDAGVHALGQVASLRVRRTVGCEELARALDLELPGDVAVRAVHPAAHGFHARHDATGRCYRYQIARRRSAFGKRTTWWVADRLDVAAIVAAAKGFEGRRDFRAFAKRSAEAEGTVVEVEACEVAEIGEFLLVRLVASHFLWNQVRRMVGALVTVGRGDARPEDVAHWLTGGAAAPMIAAPAAGLFLEAVRYPNRAWSLPVLLPVGVPVRPGTAANLVR